MIRPSIILRKMFFVKVNELLSKKPALVQRAPKDAFAG
jgi:hypothetical protein